jgi:hypothetical protein
MQERKKNEIQGEQQNKKKKKNPFYSLLSLLLALFSTCICVRMFYQYINLQLVLHQLQWLRN